MKRVIFFSLQFLSETFLVLRRIERDMIKDIVHTASRKAPIILGRVQ